MTDQLFPKQIKLVVVDVDKTLLNNKSELSERNEKAIKAALAKGVKVMLATGKGYGSCRDLIQQLGLDMPGIFTQGLTIYAPNGTLRHEKTLDVNVARRVITFAEDRGYAIVGYAQGRLLARNSNPYIDELHTKWKDVKPEYVGPLQNILDRVSLNKLVAISSGDARKIKALRWQLNAQLNGSARLMMAGVDHHLEILPPGASKGNALKALLKELKIDPGEVIAIGDGENDIEMIELVGIGVAVGNASQELKDVANEITLTNEEHGVAKIIEKYIIGEPKKETPVEVTTDAASTAPKAEAASTESTETVALATEKKVDETVTATPKPEDSAVNGEIE